MPTDDELKIRLQRSVEAQRKLRGLTARAVDDTELEGTEIASMPLLTEPEISSERQISDSR